MKRLPDDIYEKAEGQFYGLLIIVVFGVFIVVAVFAAPHVEQFIQWADGR